MEEFDDYNLLFEKISQKLKGLKHYIIGVDGFLFSGKSTLAQKLCAHLSLAYYDWDSIILRGGINSKYTYDFKKFQKICSQNNQIIIDIVLLREILTSANLIPTITIYTKELDINGNWIDKSNHEISEVHLQNVSSSLPRPLDRYLPHEKQIVDYHLKYKPHTHSNFIFKHKTDYSKDGFYYVYVGS